MLVTFQFPILDFRDLLLKENRNKLPVEDYIRKGTKNGMIHNFGNARPPINGRHKDTIPSYGRFFKAKNLIRFYSDSLFALKSTKGGAQISRRYYYDGISVGRFEVSLVNYEKKLSIQRIRNIVSTYAKLPVKIDSGKKEEKEKNILIKSSSSIANAYYHSTDKKKTNQSDTTSLVKPGAPLCIIQLNRGEKINFDINPEEKIDINTGFNLYYFMMEQFDNLKVYILEPVSEEPIEDIHNFRYAISRIHAEKENIFNLYHFIKREGHGLTENNDFKKNIINCINKTQKNLLYNTRFGIEINEITRLAFEAEEKIEYGSIEEAKKLSEEIAVKYSITEVQLLFTKLDFKQIVIDADNLLASGKYSKNSEEYELLEKLKSIAEKKSKHLIDKILERIKAKLGINTGFFSVSVENK